MNFELSLPLIWLVLFDLLVFAMMLRKKVLFRNLKGKWWAWVLLPVWLTISLIWSLNLVRGLLTVGILWLIVFAGYGMWSFRELFDAEFRRKWVKWFFGSSLVVCVWCVVQCILDLAGVGREYTLMCAGCTYQMFGFPHPNGLAIEPQFMGNLLLAPTLFSAAILCGWRNCQCEGGFRSLARRGLAPATRGDGLAGRDPEHGNPTGPAKIAVLLFVFASVLFLTFSRGAIYAFGVGLVFMVAFMVMRETKKGRKRVVKRVTVAVGIVCLAFLAALTTQGVMAEVSSTNDTFGSGVAKVLNHLSLGIIDIRGNDEDVPNEMVVEKPVENFEENRDEIRNEKGSDEAVFDGYVEESTNTRLRLNDAALTIWSKDAKNMLLGVGLGGAGRALYDNGLSPAPKEIIQNQYLSLLLETGIVGVLLMGITLLLVIKVMLKMPNSAALLSLVVAYGVSLLFFAGLPNALQIYLLPILFYMISVREAKL